MKSLSNNLNNYFLYFILTVFSIGMTGCSGDDDVDDVITDPDFTGSITGQDQTVSQNILNLQSVTVDTDAWVVVRKVNDDNTFSDPIAEPFFLEEGTHSNIEIELDNTNAAEVTLEDGDTVVAILHFDDGDGEFEFDGTTGADGTINDANGSAVIKEIVITSPAFTISDQAVVDNTITYDNVTVQSNSWIVVHDQNEDGTMNEEEIVGYAYVEAGSNDDVVVTFEEGFTYEPGQTIYSRIYLDDPNDEEFTFETDPATDIPEIFGFGDDVTVSDEGITID